MCVSVFACLCAYVSHACLVHTKFSKRHQIPQELTEVSDAMGFCLFVVFYKNTAHLCIIIQTLNSINERNTSYINSLHFPLLPINNKTIFKMMITFTILSSLYLPNLEKKI